MTAPRLHFTSGQFNEVIGLGKLRVTEQKLRGFRSWCLHLEEASRVQVRTAVPVTSFQGSSCRERQPPAFLSFSSSLTKWQQGWNGSWVEPRVIEILSNSPHISEVIS